MEKFKLVTLIYLLAGMSYEAFSEIQTCDLEGPCEAIDSKHWTSTLPLCPHPPPNLGDFKVDLKKYQMEEVVEFNSHVGLGGSWSPEECESRQKVAVLVPFRDRHQDLLTLLLNLHRFLRHQRISYTIYVIEQMDKKHFNKGAILNGGWMEVSLLAEYDCIILQDVDKFPEDTRNLYMCPEGPLHLVSKIRFDRRTDYNERPYGKYFGGVLALSVENFQQMNGFSNEFWGWGSEDDDFYDRMKHHNMKTFRVEEEVGRYREIWHPFGFVNPRRHEVKKEGLKRFATDGLNNVFYKLHDITVERLYTHIGVEVLHEDPYMDPIKPL